MAVHHVRFSEQSDKIRLRREPADGAKRERQVLWGDHLESRASNSMTYVTRMRQH